MANGGRLLCNCHFPLLRCNAGDVFAAGSEETVVPQIIERVASVAQVSSKSEAAALHFARICLESQIPSSAGARAEQHPVQRRDYS